MKRYLLVIGIAVLIVFGALLAAGMRVAQAPNEETRACTKEAKICPDGTAVGRTGPNCEFEECPAPSPVTPAPSGPVSVTARLGEMKSGLGVSLTPLAVLEDSRCPQDVQCIQAGTVRLRAQLTSGLGSATQEFKLNQPVTTEAEMITLIAVTPATKAGTPIAEAQYQFTFEIRKR
jgi:hypothetical protein